jgi:DNA-directed RNA polymerase specialized sigma24 family protein
MENPMDGMEDVEQIEDPAERAREVGRRLNLVPEFHAYMKRVRQAAVAEMKDVQGKTYTEIGRELGLHRNRVQQIYEGRSGGRRLSKPTDAPE